MARRTGSFRQTLSAIVQPFKEFVDSFRGGREQATEEQKYYPEVCAAYLKEARDSLKQGFIEDYICATLAAHYADRRNLVAQATLECIERHEPALFEKCLAIVPDDPDIHLMIFKEAREPEIVPFDFDLKPIDARPTGEAPRIVETKTEPRTPAPEPINPALAQPERVLPSETTTEPEPFAPREVGFAEGHRMWRKFRNEQDRRAGIGSQTLYSGDGTAQLETKKQEIIPSTKNRSFQEIVDEQSAQVSGDLTIPYTPNTPDAPNAPTTPKTVYRAKRTGVPFTILQS